MTALVVVRALGRASVRLESGKADFSAVVDFKDAPDAQITPERIAYAFTLQPRAALAFLFGKRSATYRNFKDVPPDVLRSVFTVAGVMKMDILVRIRRLLEKAVEQGVVYEEFKQAMKTEGLAGAGRVLPVSRLQTIYRTNVQSAYMAARYSQQRELRNERPYWQFVAILDASTTEGCKDLNGQIVHSDDAFWATNYPPRHYGCRSHVVALSEYEMKRDGLTPDDGETLRGVLPDKDFRTTPDVPFEPRRNDYPADLWREYEKSFR